MSQLVIELFGWTVLRIAWESRAYVVLPLDAEIALDEDDEETPFGFGK